MYTVLIVEDDKKLRNELKTFLKKNGYEVKYIEKFDNTINEIKNTKSDIILLDINLPNTDGEYICKEIRKCSDIPIIMITSRNNEIDELLSMNYGADDFVTKPFNTQILLAKIAVILKRANKNVNESNIVDCKEFVLNISKSMLENKDKRVELTKNELRIIYYLVMKRNIIVSRDEIMRYLWDSEMFVDDNTLTVNITRVRKKLEEVGVYNVIETRRGQGYILL